MPPTFRIFRPCDGPVVFLKNGSDRPSGKVRKLTRWHAPKQKPHRTPQLLATAVSAVHNGAKLLLKLHLHFCSHTISRDDIEVFGLVDWSIRIFFLTLTISTYDFKHFFVPFVWYKRIDANQWRPLLLYEVFSFSSPAHTALGCRTLSRWRDYGHPVIIFYNISQMFRQIGQIKLWCILGT